MTIKRFIVATAGHVDHGKSALVKAMTGTDPDRLPEEKSRGITIDLGFAHLELNSKDGDPPVNYGLGIVDVPGHEDFVKNMVAGVGAIDLALFIVAADDGWMPQTEEHLQILSYLGVKRGVVCLTKTDLLEGPGKVEERVMSVRERLEGSPFQEAPIVPTCALTGDGIDALKTEMTRVLSQAPLPADLMKPRLPVDRVFTLRGIGTVVTGTLMGGALKKGQAVVVQPAGTQTRLRSLQTHNAEVDQSGPGTRTALNLADVAVGDRSKDAASGGGVSRGDVITVKELGASSSIIDAVVMKSSRLEGQSGGAALPLKDGMRVRVHRGSSNWPGRMYLLDKKQVGIGEQGIAEIRFDQPVFVLDGDRFVIRDWSEQHTMGGGVVLDAIADRRRFRSAPQRKMLAERAEHPTSVKVFAAAVLNRDGILKESAVLQRSIYGANEVAAAVTVLKADQRAVTLGDWLADMEWWREVWGVAVAAIDAEHRDHPERTGLTLNQLRTVMKSRLPESTLFDVLVASLCGAGFAQSGTFIRRGDHRPSLPDHLQAAGARLRSALAATPFEPPSRKDLAPDGVSQQALRFLRESGEATELGPELTVATDAFHRMRSMIVGHIRELGPATVSDLRQKLGTSRRIMMPLLDRLDRDGVTLRMEDSRRGLGRRAEGI